MIFKKYWCLIILFISISVILTALIAEYFFLIQPCKMCLYQRYSYYLLIIISGLFLLLKKESDKIYLLITEILLICGLFVSLWHLGIENQLINFPSGCSNSIEDINNINDLKDQIIDSPLVMCNEINWSFLGISMVFYNSLLQFSLLIFNSIYLKNNS